MLWYILQGLEKLFEGHDIEGGDFVSLVSQGCEVIHVPRTKFIEMSDEGTLARIKNMLKNYPKVCYESMNWWLGIKDRCGCRISHSTPVGGYQPNNFLHTFRYPLSEFKHDPLILIRM